MSKTQKIWMWVFAGMFVVPEILYGALLRILHIPFIPIFSNQNYFADHLYISLGVIILEIVGVLGMGYLILKTEIDRRIKVALTFLCLFIFLFLIFSLYFTYALSNISIL